MSEGRCPISKFHQISMKIILNLHKDHVQNIFNKKNDVKTYEKIIEHNFSKAAIFMSLICG